MPNYEQFKQAWDSMGNAERRRYTEQYKNDSQFQQFANQYSQEMKNQDSSGVNNQNNTSNINGGTNTQQDTTTTQNQTNVNDTNGGFDTNKSPLSDGNNGNGNIYGKTEFDKTEQLDESKFGTAPGEISVKEGTAAQTGRPDYQAESDARLNEMANNLNQYWNTNPEFFSDRETFNRVFEYNSRQSQAQRDLLDSYWKKKTDSNKASTYTTGESIVDGMNKGEITPDIMNLIRQYNPEAYADWQKAQQDEVNKRIANLTPPRDIWDTAELWQEIIKKFGLEAGDPYDIYGTWYGMAEQLGVFRDSQQLATLSNNIAGIYERMNSNVQNLTSQLEGRYTAGYIAAKINKENSALNAQAASMQNSYSLLLQNRNQNMAIAQQAGAMKQAQGQEDTRAFNDKLRALGFARDTDSYRTPEQQAQLGLQTAAIQADLNLLNQSKSNDLALYNKYATAQLENRLSSELSDLNVKDENQLRSNLNNILSQYYSKYGDIIKRSQPQVVDDILKYAKENGISVAEALTKNFIEPLQSKQEYKNMIAKNYAAPVTAGVSINEDGTVDFSATTLGGIKYTPVSSVQLYSGMRDFIDDKKSGEYGGQCGKFVNDYLQSIGLNRIYDNKLSTKLNSINTDKNDLNNLSIGSIAVFDYQGIDSVSENARKYGHVAIVTEIDAANNRVKIKESNYDGKGTINTRWVKTDGKTLQGFFDPSKGAGASNLSKVDESKKQNYIEEAKRGMLTDTMIGKIGDLAAEQGWSSEWNEALKQGKSTNLTDAQIKLMDKTDSSFNSNAIVKEFESAINQIEQLQTALNDNSGVGDMSAIFTFMKTLDPSSVVRESEFNSAANTAGILNPSAIWQKLEKNANGKFLTAKQREDFKKIAIEFIKTKASNYNVKYNDLLKRYGEYGIDPNLAPTNMAELVISQLEGGNTTTKQTTNWYDKYTTVGGVGAGNVVTVGGTAYSSNFYDN